MEAISMQQASTQQASTQPSTDEPGSQKIDAKFIRSLVETSQFIQLRIVKIPDIELRRELRVVDHSFDLREVISPEWMIRLKEMAKKLTEEKKYKNNVPVELITFNVEDDCYLQTSVMMYNYISGVLTEVPIYFKSVREFELCWNTFALKIITRYGSELKEPENAFNILYNMVYQQRMGGRTILHFRSKMMLSDLGSITI